MRPHALALQMAVLGASWLRLEGLEARGMGGEASVSHSTGENSEPLSGPQLRIAVISHFVGRVWNREG